jgi:hypothetical protein
MPKKEVPEVVLKIPLPANVKSLLRRVQNTFGSTPKTSLAINPASDGSIAIEITVQLPKRKHKKLKESKAQT